MVIKEVVYIGLGSNLSDPVMQLKIAIKHLKQLPKTQFIICSKFYTSTPQGPIDQPNFVNMVCQLVTALTPEELLLALQEIEISQGRVKLRRWGERLIDLDILLYGQLTTQTADLTIPHVEIINRDFVLVPLSEIAPSLVVPNHGLVTELISALTILYLKPLDIIVKNA